VKRTSTAGSFHDLPDLLEELTSPDPRPAEHARRASLWPLTGSRSKSITAGEDVRDNRRRSIDECRARSRTASHRGPAHARIRSRARRGSTWRPPAGEIAARLAEVGPCRRVEANLRPPVADLRDAPGQVDDGVRLEAARIHDPRCRAPPARNPAREASPASAPSRSCTSPPMRTTPPPSARPTRRRSAEIGPRHI